MVVHFNLRVGLEIIWHEHNGDLNMAQLIYLQETWGEGGGGVGGGVIR